MIESTHKEIDVEDKTPLDLDGKPFCPTGYAQRYHDIGECSCAGTRPMTDQTTEAITVTKAQVIAACANPTFPGGGDGRFIGQFVWAGLSGESIDYEEAKRQRDTLAADLALATAIRESHLLIALYETYDGELQHPVIDCCDPHRGVHQAWCEIRDLPDIKEALR